MVVKLRCGILQLHVESGRFNQTNLENRTCNVCNINVIEDKFNFVCICPEYSNIRTKLYSQYGAKNTNFIKSSEADKFNYILENSNHDLAIYIKGGLHDAISWYN